MPLCLTLRKSFSSGTRVVKPQLNGIIIQLLAPLDAESIRSEMSPLGHRCMNTRTVEDDCMVTAQPLQECGVLLPRGRSEFMQERMQSEGTLPLGMHVRHRAAVKRGLATIGTIGGRSDQMNCVVGASDIVWGSANKILNFPAINFDFRPSNRVGEEKRGAK